MKQQLPASPSGNRVETGGVRFGDDWPGLFIRGDDAMDAMADIRTVVGLALPQLPNENAGAVGRLLDLGRLIRNEVDVRKWKDSPRKKRAGKPKRRLPPVHPGEILKEEFLKPLEMSEYRLADRIHVPRRRINEIVHGVRSVSADTALRLARFFGTSDRFWLNLQATYDLELERDRMGKRLDEIEVFRRVEGQSRKRRINV